MICELLYIGTTSNLLLVDFEEDISATIIKIAAHWGYHHCIAKLLSAALRIDDSDNPNKRDEVLFVLLTAGPPNYRAAAIRMAAQKGHHHCIAELLSAALQINDPDNPNERDAVLYVMLTARIPKRGDDNAICIAAKNRHSHCIEQLIRCANCIDNPAIHQIVMDQLLLKYRPLKDQFDCSEKLNDKLEMASQSAKLTEIDRLTFILEWFLRGAVRHGVLTFFSRINRIPDEYGSIAALVKDIRTFKKQEDILLD